MTCVCNTSEIEVEWSRLSPWDPWDVEDVKADRTQPKDLWSRSEADWVWDSAQNCTAVFFDDDRPELARVVRLRVRGWLRGYRDYEGDYDEDFETTKFWVLKYYRPDLRFRAGKKKGVKHERRNKWNPHHSLGSR